MSTGINSSQMRPIICDFDTGAGPKLLSTDRLDSSCMDSTRDAVCWISEVRPTQS